MDGLRPRLTICLLNLLLERILVRVELLIIFIVRIAEELCADCVQLKFLWLEEHLLAAVISLEVEAEQVVLIITPTEDFSLLRHSETVRFTGVDLAYFVLEQVSRHDLGPLDHLDSLRSAALASHVCAP